MRTAVHVTRIGKMRNAYKLMFENPEGKRLIRKPRRYWLLLRGGIIHSVPCKCDHFMVHCPHLSYNHSRFTHQSSLLWFAADTPRSESVRN
jgi:hypothetical protein